MPFFFLFTATPTTHIYTLSLHDALPISSSSACAGNATMLPTANAASRAFANCMVRPPLGCFPLTQNRSEEHTSELQSRFDLVCRLLLEKKKKKHSTRDTPSADHFIWHDL